MKQRRYIKGRRQPRAVAAQRQAPAPATLPLRTYSHHNQKPGHEAPEIQQTGVRTGHDIIVMSRPAT